MKHLKIFTFLFCLCIQTMLQSVPTYKISEFNIQELEQDSKNEVTLSHACQINNFGQVVGDFDYLDKNNNSPILKHAIFTWDKEVGFRIIVADTEYKRFPVINDAGIVAWSTFSGKVVGAAAHLWDPMSEQIKFIQTYGINQAMVNFINNENILFLTSSWLKLNLEDTNNTVYFPTIINVERHYRDKHIDEHKNRIENGAKLKFSTWIQNLSSVNNHFQIIGSFSFYGMSGLCNNGFIWDKGVVRDLGKEVHPSDINDFEQVVGWMNNDAFLWENEKLTIIKSNARAVAINNLGDIVGNMRFQANNPREKAFIFTDGIAHDLLNLVVDNDGWSSLEHTADINDMGQIVGYGYRYGKLTGYLLNPLKE